MIQPGRIFAHATTAQLSWHVQNCDPIGLLFGMAGQHVFLEHYSEVIMITIASQITSLTIVYSIVYSDADQRKHQSSASLAFVREIHRWPVNSSHKRPVTGKMFPFDDVIMRFRLWAHKPFVKWVFPPLLCSCGDISHVPHNDIFVPGVINCSGGGEAEHQTWL